MAGIRKQLRLAMDAVYADIANNRHGGKFAQGLSAEGYAGGYRAALDDVLQALNGYPSSNSRYWPRARAKGETP